MSVNVTWEILEMKRKTEDDKVCTVFYRILGEKDGRLAEYNGIVSLVGEKTVPYAEITQELAIEWVKEALGKEKKWEMEQEAELLAQEETSEDDEVPAITRQSVDYWTPLAVADIEKQVTLQLEQVSSSTPGVPW